MNEGPVCQPVSPSSAAAPDSGLAGLLDAQWRVVDPLDISSALEVLRDQLCPITVYDPGPDATPAPGTSCLGVARLVALNPHARRLELEVNFAGAAHTPATTRVTCTARAAGQPLSFSVGGQWLRKSLQGWCLVAAWPAEIFWMQRRMQRRLDTPLGQTFRASLRIDGQDRQLSIHNLGLGGLALRASGREASGLYVNRRLTMVELDLGPYSGVSTDLVVRSRSAFRSFLLRDQILVGCRFERVSPQVEAKIQAAMVGLQARRPFDFDPVHEASLA
jgi:flagellar brake protein